MADKYLYLIVDLLTIAVPFIASFYSQAPFYKRWKNLSVAILIPGFLFLVWDEWFTQLGVWGFNNRYLTGIGVGHLPLEEILFFICIPYACVFSYFAVGHLIEKDYFQRASKPITLTLIGAMLIVGAMNIDKAYTAMTFLLLGAFLILELVLGNTRYLSRFYLTYIFILVPFFIVNGILTGSWIESEVVWYNNAENLGIRMGTIPVEDTFYGMLLLMMNVSIFERLEHSDASRERLSTGQ